MSVKEYNQDECSECGSYNCEHFFCTGCLLKIATDCGANKDILIAYLKSQGEVSDFEIQEFERYAK
jgi:hypothetical protein